MHFKTIQRNRYWTLAACLAVALVLAALWFAIPGQSGTAANAGSQPAAAPQITWPTITWNLVASGLNSPVHINHAGDNSGRLFVVEQPGRIKIIHNGNLLSTPFLDIRDRVRSGGEEGLLSVAFPPSYASIGHFYVYYTRQDGNNVVARFHLSSNPNIADPNSEEQILLLNHPQYSNHNGGQLAFGPDGYLYIGTGDGGGAGDPNRNAQNPASLLGKLLRIKVESDPAPPPPGPQRAYIPLIFRDSSTEFSNNNYTIPPDNPFVGVPGYQEEIWALGLRNPWRFSFDHSTGDLYLGDVGQGSYEEIDFQPVSSKGGENYGWNIMEGFRCYDSSTCDQTGLTLPIHVYPTHVLGSCAVTGGIVYRGPGPSTIQGIYLYADYCNGKIWGLQNDGNQWQNQELADTAFNITSFGEDQDGQIYFADAGSGRIYRIGLTP